MKVFTFDATGTKWEISVPVDTDSDYLELQVKNLVSEYENIYSRFKDTSLVSKISDTTGTFELPQSAERLFDAYQQITRITEGAFTPLIGKTLNEAGYDKNYSFNSKVTSKLPRWDEVIEYDFPKIKIDQPVEFDFGAGGKGYIIDLVAEMLEHSEISEFIVDAGHDIRCKLKKPISIGLEHPTDPTLVIGKVELAEGSICGSSGNRRRWSNYHHIISGLDQKSPTKVTSTWVVTQNTLLADILSTSLFFVEPEVLKKFYDFEYIVLYSDFTIKKSENLKGEIFHAE